MLCKTVSFPSFFQIIFGVGTPLALQENVTWLPTVTVLSLGVSVNTGGAKNSRLSKRDNLLRIKQTKEFSYAVILSIQYLLVGFTKLVYCSLDPVCWEISTNIAIKLYTQVQTRTHTSKKDGECIRGKFCISKFWAAVGKEIPA